MNSLIESCHMKGEGEAARGKRLLDTTKFLYPAEFGCNGAETEQCSPRGSPHHSQKLKTLSK